MDPDPPPPAPRKVKFAPKAPPRRKAKPVTPNIADDDGDDKATQQALNRRLIEYQTRSKTKAEEKSSVAFSHGFTSTDTKTFIQQRERAEDQSERTDDGSDGTYSRVSSLNEMQKIVPSLPTAGAGADENWQDLTTAVTTKKKREYQEPWDCNSYYPITLPWRRPNSGDPELLDKAEFEEALEYDENSLSASELGLLGQDDTPPQMLFFQFPRIPFARQPTSAIRRETDDDLKSPEKSLINQKGKGIAGSDSMTSGVSTGTKGKEIIGSGSGINAASGNPSRKLCSLEELPEGYLGKMLVYKSGAVKLKLGDILYDVSPGVKRSFSQRVMAINTTDKHCCDLGEASKNAVVTPDVDSLLENGSD